MIKENNSLNDFEIYTVIFNKNNKICIFKPETLIKQYIES